MFRTPPGWVFVGTVAGVCACALAASWIVGGRYAWYGFAAIIALFLAVLVVAVRTIVALVRKPRTPAAWARVLAAPLLLGASLALVIQSVPERVRIAASRESLDAYARTVTAKSCVEESFRPRRVGSYTVTCAFRPDGGSRVSLQVEDPMSPGSAAFYLVGPGDWEHALED